MKETRAPLQPNSGRLRVQRSDRVLAATLVRDRGNALDQPTASALAGWCERAVSLWNSGEITVAVLDHQGSAFSVGGDLVAFSEAGDPGLELTRVARSLHDTIRRLTESGLPIVTVVRGVAAGAGLALAMLGDVVIAGPGARFTMAYTAAGVSPDCGASWLLPRRIGIARTMELALTNRVLTAQEALDWGLVSSVANDPSAFAYEAADQISRTSRDAVLATRELMLATVTNSLSEQLDHELTAVTALAGGDEFSRRLAMFREQQSSE